ncbi:DUF5107 domain-containing protein [Chloroflexota bacterium]
MGIGVRLLATFFLLWLLMTVNRCSPTTGPTDATPGGSLPGPVEQARLQVEVSPQGAKVSADGQFVGTTPLSLELTPGQHTILVELDGFRTLDQEVVVGAGEEAVLHTELEPLRAHGVSTTQAQVAPTLEAPDSTEQVPLPDLVVKQVKIELETGGACDYTSTQLGTRIVIENAGDGAAKPFELVVNGSRQVVSDGLAGGGTTSLWSAGYSAGSETVVLVDSVLQVEEVNEDNNQYTQMVPIPTLPAPCEAPTRAPPATSTTAPSDAQGVPTTHAQAVTVREGKVTIPTYPFASHITEGRNETFNMTYPVLDWEAYEASNPVAMNVAYRTIELENEYLKLTFLPDVGGRIHEVFFKPTGHRETYLNPVLKPTRWGPLEQGWWLAAGGIEWCLPVEEHGYEWGLPWSTQVDQDDGGATVTLRDVQTTDRLQAEVAVRLEAGGGSFSVRHRLENPTGTALPVKYWSNAILAPGGRNRPSGELRFVLPDSVKGVTVHSRGDDALPAYGERMSWPVVNGLDMSFLGSWNRWLGFFEDPALGGYVAVYDEGYDEGMVRVFPAEVSLGTKVFALGWGEPIAAANYTDDGSSYVELHGGLAPTFDDSVTLPAGDQIEWTETWYPVAGLGGLRYGTDLAALNLEAGGGLAQVAVATTRTWSGDAVLLMDGRELWRRGVSLEPGQALREDVPLGDSVPQTGRLVLRLEEPGGKVAAEYGAEFELE